MRSWYASGDNPIIPLSDAAAGAGVCRHGEWAAQHCGLEGLPLDGILIPGDKPLSREQLPVFPGYLMFIGLLVAYPGLQHTFGQMIF